LDLSKHPISAPEKSPKISITTLKNLISNPQKNPYFSSQKYLFQITKKPIATPKKSP
jgi:hypothetical protein